jgi:hypothetical protein
MPPHDLFLRRFSHFHEVCQNQELFMRNSPMSGCDPLAPELLLTL